MSRFFFFCNVQELSRVYHLLELAPPVNILTNIWSIFLLLFDVQINFSCSFFFAHFLRNV